MRERRAPWRCSVKQRTGVGAAVVRPWAQPCCERHGPTHRWARWSCYCVTYRLAQVLPKDGFSKPITLTVLPQALTGMLIGT